MLRNTDATAHGRNETPTQLSTDATETETTVHRNWSTNATSNHRNRPQPTLTASIYTTIHHRRDHHDATIHQQRRARHGQRTKIAHQAQTKRHRSLPQALASNTTSRHEPPPGALATTWLDPYRATQQGAAGSRRRVAAGPHPP